MEDIARFLHEHPPFSLLPYDQVRRVTDLIQIEYFPAGHNILVQDGPRAEFLYVIRRGSVDTLREDEQGVEAADTLGEGEIFGANSLIRGTHAVQTVRTREETLAYLVPAATFMTLLDDYPAFARFFASTAVERLGSTLQAHQSASPELFQTTLRELVHRAVVTIAPDATVREAAQKMRAQNISCLVVESVPPGILTDRDLRNRVVAAGLSDSTPVHQVMTSPARTLPAESLVFEGLLGMLERGNHHLPVTDGGQIIGLITHTDILRHQSRSPVFLARQLQRARSIEDLRAYADQVTATVTTLLHTGAHVSDIGRVVAVAHDRLVIRLLRDAERELGEPPAPYAWLVLGSEGRYEQTLRTDQDNALVYADEAPPEAEAYFAALAERVVANLIACGFPPCPGEIMATNPRWRQPLRVWQRQFRDWILAPDEQALLHVAIFFDYRQVCGTLDAEGALRPITDLAREQQIFLGRLASAALRHQAPLGFFRQFVTERHGSRRDLLDLKLRGTALIVDLARLFALESGSAATNTLMRIRLAAASGLLSDTGADDLAAAFELLSLQRLRHQVAQIARGEPPNNVISIAELTPLERRQIKDALRVVETVQHSVALKFRTVLIA
ncbi:MAG: DUF294 nucleotidyltransferase-like domain-containing protein [Anaerolineae bacterium]